MEINNYFNRLQHMFEADNTQNDIDWDQYSTSLDQALTSVQELKTFFQSFVNTNSQRIDDNSKKALKLANKNLKEAFAIEDLINTAKKVITSSTKNELEQLRAAMEKEQAGADSKNNAEQNADKTNA